MCTAVRIEPSLPGRQIHLSNVPVDTPSAYLKRSISIPLLDHLLSEVDCRFNAHQQTALLGMSLIPSLLVTLSTADGSTQCDRLDELYQQDLPSAHCFQSELHCWCTKWQQHLSEHGQARHTMKQVGSMYPNIRALISILCTLLVTSCSAERSFSGL